jgi:phosphoesterase RecJ-like protein
MVETRVTDYQSTLNLADAAELIRNTHGPIQVLTHTKPDGDALGSTIAMVEALRLMGKQAQGCFVGPMPAALAALPGADDMPVIEDNGQSELPYPDAGLFIILDTGAWSQIGPPAATLKANLDRTLILDHHLSGDIEAAHRFIDGASGATAQVVARLIDQLLAEKGGLDAATPAMRDGLFVGIASDTGWFRFSSTCPETHELAARLLRLGTDHAELYRQLEQMERPEKVALLTRALDSMQLLCDGKAAVMVLRQGDFTESGALQEETERLIDIPQQIGSVQVIVMLSETRATTDNGSTRTITRLSFRSKPGAEAVNVADLAARFGGGGHARAAGARIEAPADEVLPQITAALNDVACSV